MPNEQPIPSSPEEEPGEQLAIEQLQHLVQLLNQSDVTEIEIKRGLKTRLTLRKPQTKPTQEEIGENNSFITHAAVELVDVVPEGPKQHIIIAPLVGIFNNSTKLKGGGKPVTQNELLRVGQIVGTIQSLNIMNEVETPVAGRVLEVLAQNGDTVEYGQPLMVVEIPEDNS